MLTVAGRHELRLRYRPLRRVGVLRARRGGGVSLDAADDRLPGPGGRRQGTGRRHAADADRRATTATCWPSATSWASREVYRVGGAQAVAALAYGVEGLPAVDMIVGPGNLFVALAKRHVFGQVAIDCIAGPSEIVVLADDSAPPEFVAADLIAQAEHAPGASILVTWHAPLLDAVAAALETAAGRAVARRPGPREPGAVRRPGAGPRRGRGRRLRQPDRPRSTCTSRRATPRALCERIDNAGAIFLGHYTPVALGDYVAGPSHVLPTGGTARFASGLSANDFLRRSSVLSLHAGRPGADGRRRAPCWPTRKG